MICCHRLTSLAHRREGLQFEVLEEHGSPHLAAEAPCLADAHGAEYLEELAVPSSHQVRDTERAPQGIHTIKLDRACYPFLAPPAYPALHCHEERYVD